MTAASVDGHRVVISPAPTQTVIWDQIAYRGAPQDFAWVMPVHEGAYVKIASDAWLETLDATTATQASSPTLFCPAEIPSETYGGCLCEPLSGGGGGGGSFDDNQSPPVVTASIRAPSGPTRP